jgi:hypothetical protein
MSEDSIHIENIGYTANNNPSRAIRNGEEYEELIPAPDWQEVKVRRGADVSQTVHEMKKLIIKSAWQTKALSQRLQGNNTYNTCNNIWNFLFSHIKYKEDDAGEEQLRTPALSWHIRTSRGIDCDDFSIFASTILYNLGIPHYLRIARYEDKDYFQHVYVVVPQTGKHYITIDGVLDQYDSEKETAETKDFLIMGANNLNGIDVSVLSGFEDDNFNEISGVLLGVDFDRVNELEGLGQIASREEELGSIYNHLVRTRQLIHRRPHYIKQVEHPDTFLGMLDYAIGYWNTNKRDEALDVLEEKENELNRLQGLDGLADGYEDAGLFYGVEGLHGISALGRVRAKRGFFKRVKEIAKKAGQGIKKIAKALVRFNPLTITIRGGVLLAMKTNLFKMASKIKWGYLTEEEARSNGFDLEEWRNAKNQLQKIEHMFVNILQGKPEKLKKAIISGRGGGLTGLGALGYEPVTIAATGAVTTAMPFIKKVMAIIKKINFKKLVANVKPILLKLKKKRAEKGGGGDEAAETPEAEAPSPNTEEAENKSALPDTKDEDTGGESIVSRIASKASGGSSGSSSSSESTGDENLPATQKDNTPTTNESGGSGSNAKEGEENIFTKAMSWVKENPGKTALVAGGLILGITALVKMNSKKSLGRPSRGKSKKGKAKKNPPRAISGVKKKTAPKKRGKNTKRNRGGNPPHITL